ncbi:MAG: hypothetical protein KDB00_18645 [Planctomycetales bacterium]|nr:hypothetical protein [Planctomycetales bacterium]
MKIPDAAPGGNVVDAEETPFGNLNLPDTPFPAAGNFPQGSGSFPAASGNFPASSGPSAMGEKPCPMCGELIKSNAMKCRFCGEIFDPALKKRAKKSSAAGDADADMTTGDWVVAILCSGIGCIAGIVWMIQGKPKGVKMFGISLGVQFFWLFVRIMIELAANK